MEQFFSKCSTGQAAAEASGNFLEKHIFRLYSNLIGWKRVGAQPFGWFFCTLSLGAAERKDTGVGGTLTGVHGMASQEK